MFPLRHRFLLFASLFSAILAAPAPVTSTVATAEANPPIHFDFTVLSFNYYDDSSCRTQLGNMNISSLDLAAKKCFELPGNSLIFTYQEHQGTLSYYNPNEVNSK
jgi:hypothetical protein